MKGNKREALWHRFTIKKWLRRKTSGEKFNTDKLETESETSEAEVGQHEETSLLSESSLVNIERAGGVSIRSSNRPRSLLRENSETFAWTQYTDTREYKILVTTWNVGGVIPSSDLDLEDCLNLKEASDIYVLGFQEIVPLKAGNVLGSEDKGPAMKWESLIRKTLNKIPSGTAVSPGHCSHHPSPELNPARSPRFPFGSDDRSTKVSRPRISISAKENLHGEVPEAELQQNELSKKSRDKQRYNRVASKQMVGIFITVWVRSELRRHIHDLQVSSVACGILGRLGNKGSVSVRMSLHQTTFCLICTHLAPGEKEGDELRRNFDVLEIIKRTHFPRTTKDNSSSTVPDLPKTILGHDRILWFGDLNYRLASPNANIIFSMIQNEDWESLLESDQLKKEQDAGRVFEGWLEGSITFAPTYKYVVNSDQYTAFTESKAGHKRRTPAWCDRILWFGKGLRQLFYKRGECRLSDHRPVIALFAADVQVLVKHRKIKRPLQDLASKIQSDMDEDRRSSSERERS